jgi:hypothetical protein
LQHIRKTGPPREVAKTWIGMQRLESRVHLEPHHADVTFVVGFVQPFESSVFLIEGGVNYPKLIAADVFLTGALFQRLDNA